MDYVGPFTFVCVRFLVASVSMIPVIWIHRQQRSSQEAVPADYKHLLIDGISCGVSLFLAISLQQIGIKYTVIGKAAFLTALYIVLVPILGLLFMKHRCGVQVWIGVLVALAGLYFLCMTDSLTLQPANILLLSSAVFCAVHILVIDYFVESCDSIILSAVQFFVCGILGGACMFLFEEPQIGNILQAWVPFLYTGILSGSIAYTLQIIGQKGLNPTLSTREVMGCVLMSGAIVLAQLPERARKICN